MSRSLPTQLRRALWLVTALTAPLGWASDSVREQEMAQCLPGEITTWGDGRDRPASSTPLVFVYEHAGAPAWFSEALVLAVVQKAAAAWSQCGVAGRVLDASADTLVRQQAVRVQWSEKNSGGNFAQADLGRRLLAMSPAMFQLLNTRNPAHDARQTLQMVVSHEMGHHFGLMAHSRRCVDVTSYYDNGRGAQCLTRDGAALKPGVEYRALLPTACDIARCISANAARAP